MDPRGIAEFLILDADHDFWFWCRRAGGEIWNRED
jgi:hypothetical protein